MTTISLSTASVEQSYFSNVARAARALVRAVLGRYAQVTESKAQDTLSYLRSLAAFYDSVMPDLANELRYMASRAN